MNLQSSTTFFSSLIAQARRPNRGMKALALAIGAGSIAAAIHPAVASAEVSRPIYSTSAQRATAPMAPSVHNATEAQISCYKPEVQISTGHTGPGDKPRVTVVCTGGTNVMPISYFAFLLSTNDTLGLLLERVVAGWVATGTTKPLYLQSNLSDTSGVFWGCGGANCRIIDFVNGD